MTLLRLAEWVETGSSQTPGVDKTNAVFLPPLSAVMSPWRWVDLAPDGKKQNASEEVR